jgi:hypothetical protein
MSAVELPERPSPAAGQKGPETEAVRRLCGSPLRYLVYSAVAEYCGSGTGTV